MTSGLSRWGLRGALAVALASAAGLTLLGPAWRPWLVVALVGSIGTAAHDLWYWQRGPGALIMGLRGVWLGLPGCHAVSVNAVHVHDGFDPVLVELGRDGGELTATVLTAADDNTLAYRLWPSERAAPPLFPGAEGRHALGDLERALGVEAAFAQLLRAEANAPSELARVITQEAMAALLAVRREGGAGFAGVTWDGRQLAIHLRGPLAADPARALQLARPIRRALGAGSDGSV